jgi:hypothetical protein
MLLKAVDMHDTQHIKRTPTSAEFTTTEQLGCGGISAVYVTPFTGSSTVTVSKGGVEFKAVR